MPPSSADDPTAGLHAIHPVAHAIAVEEGERFRELVNSLPEDLWHDDIVITSALGSSFRSAGSPARSGSAGVLPRRREGDRRVARSDRTRRVRSPCSPPTRAHCGPRAGWTRREPSSTRRTGCWRTSPADRASCGSRPATPWNSASCELHLGHLDESRHHLEYAHGLSAEHLTRSEHIECLSTLALASYSLGDLAATDLRIAEVHAAGAPDHVMRSGFAAPVFAAEILVATDRHDSSRVPELVDSMVEAAVHTEWEPFASVVDAYSKSLVEGRDRGPRPARIARTAYAKWRPAGIGLDICDLLRADVLSSLDRGDEAFAILSDLEPARTSRPVSGAVHGPARAAARRPPRCRPGARRLRADRGEPLAAHPHRRAAAARGDRAGAGQPHAVRRERRSCAARDGPLRRSLAVSAHPAATAPPAVAARARAAAERRDPPHPGPRHRERPRAWCTGWSPSANASGSCSSTSSAA